VLVAAGGGVRVWGLGLSDGADGHVEGDNVSDDCAFRWAVGDSWGT